MALNLVPFSHNFSTPAAPQKIAGQLNSRAVSSTSAEVFGQRIKISATQCFRARIQERSLFPESSTATTAVTGTGAPKFAGGFVPKSGFIWRLAERPCRRRRFS